MQRRSLRVILAIIGLLTFASAHGANAESLTRAQLSASPLDLVNAVNNLRAAYGLPPYSINPILMAVAQNQADYMASTGNVSHTGAGGSSVTVRLLAAGYPLAGQLSLGGFRSENITSGSESVSAQAVVDQWATDSLHLTTMISADLTEIGAGVSIHAGRAYFVIDCARPTNSDVPQDVGTPGAEGSPIPTAALVGSVVIPVTVSTPDANGELIHEVQAGQTLWQIAISYNTKIDEIKRLNNLVDDNIYPGMKLRIQMNVSVSPGPSDPIIALSSPTATSLSALIAPTFTPTRVNQPLPGASSNRIASVIAILVVAFVGGGIFVWLGRLQK
jgi:uncharacterized protein YkwD